MHKHRWQGVADGVQCLTCGKKITRAEYITLTMPRQEKESNQAKKKGTKNERV